MTRQRLEKTKERFKAKGWSYRSAGPELGVSFEHLARVMNGQRESASLLRRVERLPVRAPKKPTKAAR